MTTIAELEKMTKDYYEARGNLAEAVNRLEEEIRQSKKQYLPAIRRSAEKAADRHRTLKDAVEEVPELFVKPKTLIFHGIRIGFMKAKGEIKWEDTTQVIKLIHKHFPELEDTLIKVSETPVKSALAGLPATDLKKIGVTVVETGDEVVIKAIDNEIDKLVDALLKDEETSLSH